MLEPFSLEIGADDVPRLLEMTHLLYKQYWTLMFGASTFWRSKKYIYCSVIDVATTNKSPEN